MVPGGQEPFQRVWVWERVQPVEACRSLCRLPMPGTGAGSPPPSLVWGSCSAAKDKGEKRPASGALANPRELEQAPTRGSPLILAVPLADDLAEGEQSQGWRA